MVEDKILAAVRRYLAGLPSHGIHASRGVLFGSCARGEDREWSDIDLIVIAPEFDGPRSVEQVEELWLATADSDDRIEPIPCGEREWEKNGERPVLEIARREGVMISL
ncbi:MAG TPA: nucleotidyltransferase domain-containing protein [bacterium]|nr:nucleotidyltransferase domain-containing protein [bacterium]